MERQSRYNVFQIVVKTMTREPRQRYLKVKCTVPNKIDGRITVGMNGFIGSRCYTFVQTDIFFVICPRIQRLLPFDNVIFSDECSISLQQYRHTCYRKIDERKPKPKHPVKVHIWGGISRHGATKICIFDGIMDAVLFCNILETTLVPFVRENQLVENAWKVLT